MDPDIVVHVPLWTVALWVLLLAVALLCGTEGQRLAALLATSGAILNVATIVAVAFVVAWLTRPHTGKDKGGGRGGGRTRPA